MKPLAPPPSCFRNVIATLQNGPALEWIGAISGCVLLAGSVWALCLVFPG